MRTMTPALQTLILLQLTLVVVVVRVVDTAS